MQCESFEDRLNEVLDARQPISSAADLSEHIRQCPPCRALARSYEAMVAGLQQCEVPPEPASLTPRVLSQLRRPVSTSLPRSRVLPFPRQPALAAAVAAVFLAAVGFTLLFDRGANLAKNEQPNNEHATGQERTPQLAETDQPPTNRETLPSDNQQQNQPGDILTIARTPLTTALLDPSQLKADDLISSIPASGWAHDVADGLEPVTKPTVGAINGFLQLWGVGDEGRRS